MISTLRCYRDKLVDFLSQHKKYCYPIFIVLLVGVPYLSYYGGYLLDDPNAWLDFRAWQLPIYIFITIPIIDFMLGEDKRNMSDEEEQLEQNDPFYKWVTLSVLPIYAFTLVWGMWVLAHWELSLFQQLGWIVSIGCCGGSVGITIAHELVHKSEALEQVVGGLILSLVSYAGFKVEHVYGHHVHVSTIHDASSSRYNQSLYSFLPRAYVKNFTNAWKIQSQRLKKSGKAFFSRHNELLNYYALSILLLIAFSIWQGWLGAVYFLGTSFVAFTLLEIVNYIEHYGLHREKLDNDRYERVTPHHSWNANHLVTNLFLVHLQRHSDHHAHPRRRYQVLRHFDDSPQLPAGYATMIVLALFPPLWRKVMNPRVESYYQGRSQVLDAEKNMLRYAHH